MITTTKPTIHEIGYKTYVINSYGMQSPVLVVGEKKALLIDTGSGNSDLKGLIEKHINVPLMVAITHAHPDHVAGIVQFDSVYGNEKEIMLVKSYEEAFMQKFLDYFINLIGVNEEIGYFKVNHQLLPWDKLPEIQMINDGFKFDLGGRTITAYDCPTHTPGHMVFVDDLTRTLFAGDALGEEAGPANNPINPPVYVSLETELRGLENLKKHEREFNRIIPGHMGWGGNFDVLMSMEPSVIDRLIAVGRGVLNKELEIKTETTEVMGYRGYGQIGTTKLYFFPQYLYDSQL